MFGLAGSGRPCAGGEAVAGEDGHAASRGFAEPLVDLVHGAHVERGGRLVDAGDDVRREALPCRLLDARLVLSGVDAADGATPARGQS